MLENVGAPERSTSALASISSLMAAQRSPAVFFTFLCLLLELSGCRGARAVPPAAPQEPSTEFIRISCAATEYPALCFSSLSAYAATVKTSPSRLADVALSVALAGARSASTALARTLVGAGGRGIPPRVAAAARDCVENVGDGVDELRESLAEMEKVMTTAEGAGGGGGKKGKLAYQINSIQTWVSAALTDDDTCVDGFAGGAMDGEVKDVVRSHVVEVAQLSSNALALVNCLASSLNSHP